MYTHTRLDTDEVFYVGIGKRETRYQKSKGRTRYARAYEKTKRSTFWKSVIQKTDYRVDIIFETTSEAKVKLKEQELIKQYGRRCCDSKGTLVNFSPGGDRVNRGFRSYGVRITQIDPKTKHVVKIWDELMDIEKQIGYLKTNIVKCCRKVQLSAYGYLWEYTDDRSFDHIKPRTARKKTTNRRVGILVYDRTGKLVNNFSTQEEAASYYGVDRSTLHRYLHSKTKHKFLTFKYDTWIELHPEEAKELGLSESRLKTETNE